MRYLLLAVAILAPLAARAQSLQSGTIGGMPYYELPASGGCSAATPCSVVTYLGYQDETQSATASALQNYFGGSFAAANPHTVVIAPMLTGNQDSSYNWGGYDAVTNAQTAQMVGVVQGVEQSMGNTVNAADSVVTGGSLGGDGTQSALIGYGPKGTVQAGVFDAGLSFDAADYAAAGNATDIAALCGVPLTAVHGTADTNQSVTYDEGLQSAIDGNPACGNSFNFVPIQGAGHGTWSGPNGYSAGVGSGTPLGWLSSELTGLAGHAQPATAPAPVESGQPLIPQNSLSSITSSAAPAAPAAPTSVSAGSSQSCTVPGPAAGAGFNTETLGQQPLAVGTTPNPTTGFPEFSNGADVVPFDFFGTSWTDIGETSGNGSVTLNGTGETYGNGLATASQTPAGQTLNGIAFGGGGYYQVTMSGNGPMSFWMNDAETMNGESNGSGTDGLAGGWMEADIAEFDSTGVYGFALHNWTSTANGGQGISTLNSGSPASPPGANYSVPNTYGMLWVPATATTQGSVKWYFNGQQVGNTITWNQYIPGQAAADNPYAVMDALHMVPILGAGAGTTATFSNLQVWQASAANDIGTGAAAAAAVQPCAGGETATPTTATKKSETVPATAPATPTPTTESTEMPSAPSSSPSTAASPTVTPTASLTNAAVALPTSSVPTATAIAPPMFTVPAFHLAHSTSRKVGSSDPTGFHSSRVASTWLTATWAMPPLPLRCSQDSTSSGWRSIPIKTRAPMPRSSAL
jgi:hypothetical protein